MVLNRAAKYAYFLLILNFLLFSISVIGQSQNGKLVGTIVDANGSLIAGATVTLTATGGTKAANTTTSNNGTYSFNSLESGSYVLIVSQDGFNEYKSQEVIIENGKTKTLDVQMSVKELKAEVSVGDRSELSSDSNRNLDAVILDEKEIESLPSDEESLTEILRAMAGPGAGPTGAQIYVDGFSGGEVPPKDTIREIRINHNPFSSEFASLGHGRIHIFTRPGTGRIHGEGRYVFSDESLSARNPFSREREPNQNREFWVYMNTSLIKDKLSTSVSFDRDENDQSRIIRASGLDSELREIQINEAVATPRRRTQFAPRIDFQINKNHTLVARYNYRKEETKNLGVGDFSLFTRAFDSNSALQTIRLTETAIINEKLVNETRFQFINRRQDQIGQDNSPSINVFGAFNGGGAPIGEASGRRRNWELANISTWSFGNHAFRAGGQLRGVHLDNISPQNFNGTYSFAGGVAPQLDTDNRIVLDAAGQPITLSITSLERYRRTLAFQQLGFTPEDIRSLGGGATQFSIAAGNPRSKISQLDFGGFLQNDWRIRSNLTLSFGLRYEAQTNVSNNLNLAPRVSFAWSPNFGNKDSKRKIVIRGGAGIFFNRIGENVSLRAERFDGINQQQFIVGDFSILDAFPNIPLAGSLEVIPQTIWRVSDDIRSPYTIQSSLSFERQLPFKFNFVATFINTRILNMLRARNINVPSIEGIRPFEGGNIFQNESSGIFKQRQLTLGVRKRSKRFFLSANYAFNKAESDTDGANSFPANPFDLSNEFGRSSLDIRHRFTFRGFLNTPFNTYLSTFVIASSGAPFNITTGADGNGDSLFNDRPAIATYLARASVVSTNFGDFDTDPMPGQQTIPRNFGKSPGFFAVNMSFNKTIGIGSKIKNKKGKHSHRGDTNRGYNLTFGIRVNNIFNNVNLAPPVGNLSSPLFGTSTSILNGYGSSRQRGLSTNRAISLSLRLSY